MKAFFEELFAYNHHYNQQLAAYIGAYADQASDKTFQLFSHILNAHHIWNSRISGQNPVFGVWQSHYHNHFGELDQANYDRTTAVLASVTDLGRVIRYSTTTGAAFENSIKDILFHVINHSTYHRGQIASQLRQSGLEPLPTDYIFYKR